MKKHNGMRPHDIAVLLKIISKGSSPWQFKDLAAELLLSGSEISESINRSVIAGLISSDKKTVNRLALLDFLKYGFKYVFPQQLSALVRGVVTAHSASPLNTFIQSDESVVWPHANGMTRGQSIQPLYPNLPEACLKDASFYELVALLDALRIGKVREQLLAFELLKKRIEHEA
jgi:predicted transcriptional regulator